MGNRAETPKRKLSPVETNDMLLAEMAGDIRFDLVGADFSEIEQRVFGQIRDTLTVQPGQRVAAPSFGSSLSSLLEDPTLQELMASFGEAARQSITNIWTAFEETLLFGGVQTGSGLLDGLRNLSAPVGSGDVEATFNLDPTSQIRTLTQQIEATLEIRGEDAVRLCRGWNEPAKAECYTVEREITEKPWQWHRHKHWKAAKAQRQGKGKSRRRR